MKLHFVWLFVLVASFLQRLAAQGYGEITGHVYCADQNRPARMATVMAQSASEVESYNTRDMSSWIAPTTIKSAIDGSFVLPHLRPGDYYVFATLPGYVSPLARVTLSENQLRHPNKEGKEVFAKLLSKVEVKANLTTAVELRLERGAAISGRVLFDDGSPAPGVLVRPLTQVKGKWIAFSYLHFQGQTEARTNDQGSYRFGGLPAGDYLIAVDVEIGDAREKASISVYSGGLFFTNDAKPIRVELGEERTGEDLPIPLGKIHSVSGSVVALRDGHPINDGTVILRRADDRVPVAEKRLLGFDNGIFKFNMVPEGDYVLAIDGRDVQYDTKGFTSTFLHGYRSSERPIHVGGDMSSVTVELPEIQPNSPGQH